MCGLFYKRLSLLARGRATLKARPRAPGKRGAVAPRTLGRLEPIRTLGDGPGAEYKAGISPGRAHASPASERKGAGFCVWEGGARKEAAKPSSGPPHRLIPT